MKLKLNFQFVGIDNKPQEGDGFHAGKILGNWLWGSSWADKLGSPKMKDWAQKLFNAPHELELDRTDRDILLGFLELLGKEGGPQKLGIQASNGFVGQLIDAIGKQWDEQKAGA